MGGASLEVLEAQAWVHFGVGGRRQGAQLGPRSLGGDHVHVCGSVVSSVLFGEARDMHAQILEHQCHRLQVSV